MQDDILKTMANITTLNVINRGAEQVKEMRDTLIGMYVTFSSVDSKDFEEFDNNDMAEVLDSLKDVYFSMGLLITYLDNFIRNAKASPNVTPPQTEVPETVDAETGEILEVENGTQY